MPAALVSARRVLPVWRGRLRRMRFSRPACFVPAPAKPWRTPVRTLILAVACYSLAQHHHARAAARIEAVPLSSATPEDHRLLFERLSAEKTGLHFVHQWSQAPRFARLLNSSVAGGGVCVADYDGDGLPNVFLTRATGGNRLYRNLGEFRFADRASIISA